MHSKNLRKHLTLKEKMKIISSIESGVKQADLAKKYSVSRAMICQIKKNKPKIIEFSSTLPENTKKNRTTSYTDIDASLYEWFLLQRQRSIPINGPTLQEKAKKIAKFFGMDQFECSDGWLSRFKKRHQISNGIISGESLSVNQATVENWIKNEWPILRNKFEEKDIFNADETALFYKLLPNKTLKLKGETCSGGKLSKERITVYLCTSMTGEKRKPLIIGKYKNPRCFKNQLFNNVTYRSNRRAWMTSEVFKENILTWDLELKKINRKILLLIDNCTPHLIEASIFTNITLAYFPPNTTSVLQPLDNGIIKNFKVFYKKSLISRLIESIDAGNEFNITILDAIKIIESSWNAVTKKTITNCFNIIREFDKEKITTSNKDDIIDKDTIVDIVSFFESEKQFIEYLEIEDAINTDGMEEQDLIDTFSEDKNDSIDNLIQDCQINENEALNAVRTLRQYYSMKIDCNEIYKYILMIERDLESVSIKKKARQRKITEYLISEN